MFKFCRITSYNVCYTKLLRETDFVAKNEGFVALAQSFLDVAVDNKPADLDALKALSLDGRTLADHVTVQTGVIGEKIDLSYFGCRNNFV